MVLAYIFLGEFRCDVSEHTNKPKNNTALGTGAQKVLSARCGLPQNVKISVLMVKKIAESEMTRAHPKRYSMRI